MSDGHKHGETMTRNAVLAAAIAALSLAACTEESAKKVRAEDAVKAFLNDPGSATFENVQPGKTDRHICGTVNAKNRMGAYVGKTPFVYTEFSPSNGFAVLMNGSPTDLDFKLLPHHPDKHAQLDKLEAQCRAVEHWNNGCAISLIPLHRLCKPAMERNYETLLRESRKL